ncbi:hypothetical protein FT641_27075 [Bacillus paranthracis]|uniref:hypothetical protein n=1 Tax=Bacillus paranthracis TaxID=2026186 RepID=UPI00187A42C3|nr:hypothetical protein [Bacillus paranthracis]MBE7117316.1 hypothetical protein [Bacillus paranthracis]MBE7134930.1 hypothetical protein [Bacillus paranthracis]MBE7156339.1 hypothetical protein [Bacillus paranthracis]
MIKVTTKQIENARFEWRYKDGTNFTSVLFALIQKADSSNFTKLAQVYPAECYIVAVAMENKFLIDKFDVLSDLDKCPHCGSADKQLIDYVEHVTIPNVSVYLCNACDERFSHEHK